MPRTGYKLCHNCPYCHFDYLWKPAFPNSSYTTGLIITKINSDHLQTKAAWCYGLCVNGRMQNCIWGCISTNLWPVDIKLYVGHFHITLNIPLQFGNSTTYWSKVINHTCLQQRNMSRLHQAAQVSTVRYVTIRDRIPWSSLRFHRQQYPYLSACRNVAIDDKARQ